MLHLFKKREIHQPDCIEIKQSPLHEQGVFAVKEFYPGDIIEISPVILLAKSEREYLQTTSFFSYYFLINNETTPVAIGLGYSSLYNHAYKANAVYTISLKNASITIKSCKSIRPGDEITLNYNGNPDDETPVYFPSDPIT